MNQPAVEDEIKALLNERHKTHGNYSDHAKLTQELKRIFRARVANDKLTSEQQEAIDMIFHKIGRIGAGDPNFKDHWDDIAGYAKLVADRCKSQ